MDKYIGRLLDNRYEILEVIGTGGMAVVYKARCHRLNRLVAIKILKDDFLEDEDFRSRFHSESQAVAMLSHPNIVSVYDVSTSVMVDYIVMELVEGISLKQYMEKKGVLNWKETLHFAIQIGKALEHAHSRGIVHRDIKPHNVMVLKNGSVKVMDFGIARLMSKGSTLTKEALGSVHYISPEQAKGGQVDDRSDLYSLGVVMYEMMCGRPPYDGETPVSVAIQHINGGAAMPSTLNPNIPGGLEQIIMKAMAHDRAKRFTGATEMLRDMDEFRKDPAILFDYNGNGDEVIRIHKPINPVISVTPTPTAGKTAAERAVNKANGLPNPKRPAKDHEAARRRKEEEERRRNRVAMIAIGICAAVMLIAVVVIVVILSGSDSSMVEVPALIGEKYSDRMTVKGLTIGEITWERSEKPRGTILGQDPRAGTNVELNTKINLTVSEGEGPGFMENLVGFTEKAAEDYLLDFGLNLHVQKEYVFDETIKKGQVISTDPAEGEPLDPEQTVTLVISNGNQPVMDKLQGVTEDYARKILGNYPMELTITIVEEFHDEIAKGRVIDTEPAEGTKLEDGQEVVLIMSLGRPPLMEDLSGMHVDIATQRLLELDLDLEIVVEEEANEDFEAGTVMYTDPVADLPLEQGQTVTLTVSLGKQEILVNMPNIVGMTWLEAKNKLEEVGLKNYDFDYLASMEKENTVVDQSERADMPVDVTTPIVIYLSDGSLVKKTVDVELPNFDDLTKLGLIPADYEEDDEVVYSLSIVQGETIIASIDGVVLGANEYASVDIIASGLQTYEIKIDGVPWKNIQVSFAK
ncbi:MAG: Stk1 family PASTA domain-containing Ser/Thr kinase [Oscillospiraceae bacterium]|nr:Stk1 family PASTA domain-containing Ser/Thr kinase [Oscillospiraceae bacterium]